jgi:glycine/D-amino acid oxidase-like deaminating enzyme
MTIGMYEPRIADVGQAWGACIDSTPDTMPVISPVDALSGSFLAAGFSGHGFGLGPAADHLTGDAPAATPAPLRLARLVDGSKMGVGAI